MMCAPRRFGPTGPKDQTAGRMTRRGSTVTSAHLTQSSQASFMTMKAFAPAWRGHGEDRAPDETHARLARRWGIRDPERGTAQPEQGISQSVTRSSASVTISRECCRAVVHLDVSRATGSSRVTTYARELEHVVEVTGLPTEETDAVRRGTSRRSGRGGEGGGVKPHRGSHSYCRAQQRQDKRLEFEDAIQGTIATEVWGSRAADRLCRSRSRPRSQLPAPSSHHLTSCPERPHRS